MGDSTKSTTPDIINVNHLLVRKAQEAMRESKRQQKILLDHSLANHEVATRIYHSALLLLAANTRQEIAQIIRSYLPPILDVAAAGLLVVDNGILAEENVGTPLTPSFLHSLTAKDGIFLGAPRPIKPTPKPSPPPPLKCRPRKYHQVPPSSPCPKTSPPPPVRRC